MAFHESANFPTQVNGSSGGPGHNTLYLEAKGGGLTRLARWDGARRRFQALPVGITPEQAADVLSFYLAREGGLHGFRFKDWSDYSTGTDGWDAAAFGDEVIGTGDGTTTQFQLVKRYTSGGETKVRTIKKPVSGTVKSGVATTAKVEGVDFTVDHTTGIITYAVAPTLGQQVTAGCEFDVPCVFGPGADQLLQITMDSFRARSVPSVELLEDFDPSVVDDEYHYGGAFEASFSIPYQITPLMGRVAGLTPGAATDVLLPAATLYEEGGPYMFLTNLSGTHAITVKSLGASIGTISTNATKTLLCALVSSVKTWRLV